MNILKSLTQKHIIDNANASRFIKFIKENEDEYRPFTLSEEKEFISKNINNIDYVKNELIKRNIRLVLNFASKYAYTTDSFDDLVQSGIEGLSKAAENFDFTRKTKFCSYAGWYIKKYILKSYYDKYNSRIKYNSLSLDKPYMLSNSKSSEKETTTYENYIDSYISSDYNLPIQDLAKSIYDNDIVELVSKISAAVDNTNELSAFDKKIYHQTFLNKSTLKVLTKELNTTNNEILKSKNKVKSFIKNMLSKQYNILSYSDICNL